MSVNNLMTIDEFHQYIKYFFFYFKKKDFSAHLLKFLR
jgi:hypothetical protein